MMNKKIEKAPIFLDFSGSIIDMINRLESMLYTSGWNKYLIVDPNTPNESMLLLSLIRESAVVIAEVYYTFTHEFTEELRNRAENYFHRLRKKNMDVIYLNAVNYFSKYKPDIEKTDNGALFYPEMNAYVRCGDLSPEKMFELMQKDGCERVIVFGSGLHQDREEPWEVFHSFEMRAPKEYILEKLSKLQDEKTQAFIDAVAAAGENEIFDKIIPPPPVYNEE